MLVGHPGTSLESGALPFIVAPAPFRVASPAACRASTCRGASVMCVEWVAPSSELVTRGRTRCLAPPTLPSVPLENRSSLGAVSFCFN